MIYLDNAATAPACKAAKTALKTAAGATGNPSSLHSLGLSAEKSLNSAREIFADMLRCNPAEVFFTSGGTESNNIAVLGAARARKRLGNRIVITSTEHSSVYEPAKILEFEGFEILLIKPFPNGDFSSEDLANIDKNTILISAIHTNNETGTPSNLAQIREYIEYIAKFAPKKPLFHTDAVQAFAKESVTAAESGADLISFSAHKFGGIGGAGGLFVKKGTTLRPLIHGGGQQSGIRPGTEAVALISAFAAAAEYRRNSSAGPHVAALNRALRDGICRIPGGVIHSPDNASPYILSFSAGRVKSQTMLHFLESRGIFVSSGSACDRGKPSRILLGAGVSPDLTDKAIRVSFSPENTLEEVAEFIKIFELGIKALAKK